MIFLQSSYEILNMKFYLYLFTQFPILSEAEKHAASNSEATRLIPFLVNAVSNTVGSIPLLLLNELHQQHSARLTPFSAPEQTLRPTAGSYCNP